MTTTEILETEHSETMSVKTIKDHIELYAQLFKWAIREEYYSRQNPFDDVAPKDTRTKSELRKDFDDEDLMKIFSGHMFSKFNPKRDRPHHYWGAVIALYTGMRNAEIGALEVSDIRQISNDESETVWYFNVHTHDGKTPLKTKNATRQVPIHPKLIELGIIEYRDSVKARGDSRLFEYLNWDKTDGYGRYIGEHFNQYLRTINVYEKTIKVFYSFRHTLATKLERAGISDARIELISGRTSSERKSTGRSHYIDPAHVSELYKDIMNIDFDFALTSITPYHKMAA
jgi:integrase